MKHKKQNEKSGKRSGIVMLILSIASFFISSAAILLMPLSSFEQDGNVVLAYILAITFWVFLMLGIVFILILGKKRKKDTMFTDTGGIVFLRFFKNKPATVFNVLLIVGILSLVVSLLIIRTLPSWLTLAGTFTTVFSMEMHALLNGKNYEWLCTEHDSEFKFMLD